VVCIVYNKAWGYAVALLVEALCYKPEGRGVRFPMLSLNFSIDLIRSRDSSVGIATDYGLDDRGAGVRVPVHQPNLL
jgi:hypothetical protein